MLLSNLGDLYHTLGNLTEAFVCFQTLQTTIQNLTKQQISKFNFYEQKIKLLYELDQKITESKLNLSKLPTQTEQQKKVFYQKELQDIQKSILKFYPNPNQQNKPQKQQLFKNQIMRILLTQNIQYNKMQQQIDILIKQNRNQRELLLIDLDKPENKHLAAFILATSQISTDLQKQTLIQQQKVFKVASVVSRPIPVVGDAFGIINAALDYFIEKKNEHKFNRRFRFLGEILIEFAVNPQQLEIEVQMAAIQFGKQQQPNIKERKRAAFLQKVDEYRNRRCFNHFKLFATTTKKIQEIFEDAIQSSQNNSQATQIQTTYSLISQIM